MVCLNYKDEVCILYVTRNISYGKNNCLFIQIKCVMCGAYIRSYHIFSVSKTPLAVSQYRMYPLAELG